MRHCIRCGEPGEGPVCQPCSYTTEPEHDDDAYGAFVRKCRKITEDRNPLELPEGWVRVSA